VVTASMAMTAVVLLAMAFVSSSVAFVALVAVLGFFLYALRPVLQAWLLEVTPRNMGGSSIGVLFGAQSLGSSVGPLIGGLIADRFGLGATFYFLAGTIVVANLLVLLMPRADEDRP
jgi:predicted MFS family arabinose efflux permease